MRYRLSLEAAWSPSCLLFTEYVDAVLRTAAKFVPYQTSMNIALLTSIIIGLHPNRETLTKRH